MRLIVIILIALGLVGCGREPASRVTSTLAPEKCAEKNACTGAPGSTCGSRIEQSETGCTSYKQDYQVNANCDPEHPTDLCGGGWGAPQHLCCAPIQGPGKVCEPGNCEI